MNALKAAINNILSGDAALNALATQGTHYLEAPPNTPRPFVVFYKLPGGGREETMGGGTTWVERWVFVVKAVTEATATKSADELAGEIGARVEELLINVALTVPGFAWLSTRKVGEVEYSEPLAGNTILHAGPRLEITLQKI